MNRIFRSQDLIEFCQRHVADIPTRYAGIVKDVLTVLDDEGDISSLFRKTLKWQRKEKGEFENLSKISLLEHSVDVADAMSGLVDKKTIMHPLAIITGLAHDLGKIARIYDRSLTEFDKRVHAYSSEKFIIQLIDGRLTVKELEAVAEAIKFHHEPALGGQLVFHLKKADSSAREHEGTSQKYRPASIHVFERPPTPRLSLEDYRERIENMGEKAARVPDPSAVDIPWFDLDEFIARLTPRINAPENIKLEALSTQMGICYFKPHFLFDILKKIALEKHWLEISQIEMDEQKVKDTVAFLVYQFRERDLICEALLPDSCFFFWLFFVNFKNIPTENHYFVPIKKEAFNIRNEALEKRKMGKISWITGIWINKRGQKDAQKK